MREKTIAEELASQQREISVAAFFEQNRQMLGFGSKSRSLVTTVKEGVDNAIDASEEADILPEVSVNISETDNGYYEVSIQDNGPGIKEEQIPKIFGKLLYGSRFSSRVQRRGQQGIGISAAVLYAQQSTGKNAKIKSKVNESDTATYFEVKIDTDNNQPVVEEKKDTEWSFDSDHGTEITVFIDATFRSRKALHKYIRRTAIVNPHLSISLDEPKSTIEITRSVDELPKQPTEIKPHPHGIDIGTLQAMFKETDSHSISGFLQSEFTRVGQKTANKIISEFSDRYYGRHMRYKVPQPDKELDPDAGGIQTTIDSAMNNQATTLTDHIAAHVNRKGTKPTKEFSQRVAETLYEQSPVSKVEVANVIDEIASDIVTKFNTTFGDTVKEKATDGAWTFLRSTRYDTILSIVDESTSSRKDGDVVSTFTEAFLSRIDSRTSDMDSLSKNELWGLVTDVADRVSNANVSFGDTAQEKVSESIWNTMDESPADPPLIRELKDDRDSVEMLQKSMQEISVMAPPAKCLSPITEEHLERGIREVYDADFYTVSSRDANAHSGNPFLVEAGLAYGDELEDGGDIQLLRFANRVPLVYKQGGCAITKTVSGIRWNNYKLSDKGSGLPQGPVALVVHVASTNVPFTSESKDAVADVEVVKEEIERAVRDVARELKRHIKQQRSVKERRRKQDKITDILPEFGRKLSSILGKETPDSAKSIARIMNGVYVNVDENGEGVNIKVVDYTSRDTTPDVLIKIDEGMLETLSSDQMCDCCSLNSEGVLWELSSGSCEELTLSLGETDVVGAEVVKTKHSAIIS